MLLAGRHRRDQNGARGLLARGGRPCAAGRGDVSERRLRQPGGDRPGVSRTSTRIPSTAPAFVYRGRSWTGTRRLRICRGRSTTHLRQLLAVDRVQVVNDLVAIASAVPALEPVVDLHTLNAGRAVPGKVAIAVVAPGTGLGEALVRVSARAAGHGPVGGRPRRAGAAQARSGGPPRVALARDGSHVGCRRVCVPALGSRTYTRTSKRPGPRRSPRHSPSSSRGGRSDARDHPRGDRTCAARGAGGGGA